MASKTITISEEAYERLKSRKEEKESFTDVINKLTRERSLNEIAGILSDDEADRLKEKIEEGREKTKDKIDRIKKEMEYVS
ncbi:MAG: antitoxin VapB family protein [Candidatus Thermoplasmatota archaeon]|nr:antitoxin VapB family protein [Candidatus Thermoplasmatota archaeon]MBS3789648.1 antitoxin VapB family protein [Candidatus Thermoplasmatota archaeon]